MTTLIDALNWIIGMWAGIFFLPLFLCLPAFNNEKGRVILFVGTILITAAFSLYLFI